MGSRHPMFPYVFPRPLKSKKASRNDWPNCLIQLVGAAGFELATPCTPCKCATRLRYAPKRRSIPAGIPPLGPHVSHCKVPARTVHARPRNRFMVIRRSTPSDFKPYKRHPVTDAFDAIVIGSGIGGLATAA